MTEHETRNRAVQCSRCAGSTWNVHAICDRCITAGRFIGSCDCEEGIKAQQSTQLVAS